ncbi:repeatmulti-domain protein [Pyrenophora tritici-repentis]|uniref:DUF3237 multi-domain protein n=1 Tax=Pyrenophora tritici-repentis TaxID=45151 RepID=A0A834RX60_9PLEO|nr:DUF3237 multi-domain protein [Pyrenophora tritici-repentis]KAF7571503.1 DUF3237 multi-domain protein [Pyrenophora tritici-repentis]KAI1528658.1 repeatmulti-domain protein [Pyrenophora tritici-repentis]KAI1548372.1 repeatmulti-domain protein [Pyrenophora tritici-repentis]KAI1557424.1 repeatmulti-domain protein [Pyrenophora tritici-repentis]
MKYLSNPLFFLATAAFSLAQAPPSPEFNWILSANVTPGTPIIIGPVPGLGIRTALPIAGGIFWGPFFNGTLAPVGVDAGIVTSDGKFYPGGTAILQTNDGANIIFRDNGYQTGDTIYGAVTFETGAVGLEWLNKLVLAGPIPEGAKKSR